MDPLVGAAEGGGARGDVDDRAARAAEVGGHAGDRLAQGEEAALHVGRQHIVQHRLGDLVQARDRAGDAGVVDQGGGAAKLAIGGLEQAGGVGGAGGVGLDGDGDAAGGADLAHHALGMVLGAAVR